ncbi:MAG: hypothetical protein JRF61_25190, partial [Deltaproteobacteria bacterium]|nr:hypothetical protein [Deltaproteobacteria bacterium]
MRPETPGKETKVIPFARHFSTLVSLVLLVWLLGGCGDAPPDADPATLREVRQGKLVGRSLADGEVHFAGQPIAVVVADTPRIARLAASAINAEYEELPA